MSQTEIRKGAGATKLESLVLAKVLKDDNNSKKTKSNQEEITLALSTGITIGVWKNNTFKLNKDIKINEDKFLKYLIKFF